MGATCYRPLLHWDTQGSPEGAALRDRLAKLLEERPYLNRKAHPLSHWVVKCQDCIRGHYFKEAEDHLHRIETALQEDDKRLRSIFDKFDLDRSGQLEATEFKHFVTYVGFGPDMMQAVVAAHDRNADGVIAIGEFADFVGRAGGMAALFSQRRGAMAAKADGSGQQLLVGSRVRAHMREDGEQSKTVMDARVLAYGPEVVRLEFSLPGQKQVQEVPLSWVQADMDLHEALSSIGILDDAQHYWTILLPPSEQHVVKALTSCQRQALYEVRRQATVNHNSALQQLRDRCNQMGIGDAELWSVMTWVRDLAPILIHLDMDTVGQFLEQDTHYRNQFETNSSKGLLCGEIRSRWEQTLFGGSYDNAVPFERPKYGVLDVMNDFRGALCARQYGDSYLVLKNVRLRCTFAPEDSGGICGSRLAVLDQYAHVLLEYSDEELREVSHVANAKDGSEERIGDSGQLDGFHYKEAQIHGELDLKKHIKRLVAHPRHRVDGWSESRMRRLCDQHGWEFIWMEEERNRRIHEEREAQDSRVLEMSWSNEEHPSLMQSLFSHVTRGLGNLAA